MSFIPLNSGFPAQPQTSRDVAEAILAQLDREAAEQDPTTASYRSDLATPFMANRTGNDGWSAQGFAYSVRAPEANPFDVSPLAAATVPFPDARNDDDRIENILWLLKQSPIGWPAAENSGVDGTGIGITNLFGLIGEAEAADGKKKPPGKFDFRGAGIAGIVLRGERKGESYARAHEERTNRPTDWRVDTYDPDDFWKWLLGLR